MPVDVDVLGAPVGDRHPGALAPDGPEAELDELGAALAGSDALDDAGTGTAPSGRDRLARGWSTAWPKLAALALAIGAWQLIVLSEWRPSYVLPGPGRVLSELGTQITTAGFWAGVGLTLRRAATGYTLALLIGGSLGLAVARIRLLRTAVGSLVTGLQTMPSIAWFPLAILLFKLSEGAILFVVVLGAAPSIANGILAGVDQVPPGLVRAGRVLGADGLRLQRYIVLPAALPSLLAGAKQGWAFAWRSLMAGELLVLTGQASIGARLQTARELSDAPGLLAMMLVVLVVGIVVDAGFSAADRAVRRRRGLVVA